MKKYIELDSGGIKCLIANEFNINPDDIDLYFAYRQCNEDVIKARFQIEIEDEE